MSTKRIINAVIAIAIAIALVSMVVYYWNQLGCGKQSLIVSLIIYPSFVAALWSCVDEYIKEKEA